MIPRYIKAGDVFMYCRDDSIILYRIKHTAMFGNCVYDACEIKKDETIARSIHNLRGFQPFSRKVRVSVDVFKHIEIEIQATRREIDNIVKRHQTETQFDNLKQGDILVQKKYILRLDLNRTTQENIRENTQFWEGEALSYNQSAEISDMLSMVDGAREKHYYTIPDEIYEEVKLKLKGLGNRLWDYLKAEEQNNELPSATQLRDTPMSPWGCY